MSADHLALASCTVHVAISKIAQSHPWVPFRWQLDKVHSVDEAAPLPENSTETVWAQSKVLLFADEADGYYLNCTAPHPAWFVHYRLDEELGDNALPEVRQVTLSYNEAGRLMDGGEIVESVPTDDITARWLAEFAQKHFVPEPRKRRRPASFLSPDKR